MENTTMNMPILALRGLTIFPGCILSFDVERDISIRALERAMESNQYIFLVAQREIGTAQPGEKDLYSVGTVSVIRQVLRISENSVRVMMEGKGRAKLRRLWQTEPYLQGNVETVRESKARISDLQLEALLRHTYTNLASTRQWLRDWATILPQRLWMIGTQAISRTLLRRTLCCAIRINRLFWRRRGPFRG